MVETYRAVFYFYSTGRESAAAVLAQLVIGSGANDEYKMRLIDPVADSWSTTTSNAAMTMDEVNHQHLKYSAAYPSYDGWEVELQAPAPTLKKRSIKGLIRSLGRLR